MKTRVAMLALLGALAACVWGCVERQMLIRWEPAGGAGREAQSLRAPVWVDEEYVGLTPVTYRFSHYGTRRVRVGPIREAPSPKADSAVYECPAGPAPAGEGTVAAPEGGPGPLVPPDESGRIIYLEAERMFTTRVPWYETFPIDFVFDVLVPFTIVDRHEVTLRLHRADEMPGESGTEATDELIKRAEAFREKALTPVPELEE